MLPTPKKNITERIRNIFQEFNFNTLTDFIVSLKIRLSASFEQNGDYSFSKDYEKNKNKKSENKKISLSLNLLKVY